MASTISFQYGIKLVSNVANGSNAAAITLDTHNTYSTDGANLLRIRNNGTSVLEFNFQGGIDHVNSGASTAAHSQSLNLNWSATSAQTSSGQYSAVIGRSNVADSTDSIAIGASNEAIDPNVICIGSGNKGEESANIVIGTNNRSGTGTYYSITTGYNAYNIHTGTFVHGAGGAVQSGERQSEIATLYAATTDATQTTLALPGGGSWLTLPADASWVFSVMVIGRSDESDGNDSAAYRIEGCIARDESSNTALVGSVTKTVIAESAGATAWDVTVEANDTNESLDVKVTGEAATNIKWVARVDIAQIIYA